MTTISWQLKNNELKFSFHYKSDKNNLYMQENTTVRAAAGWTEQATPSFWRYLLIYRSEMLLAMFDMT